MGCCHLEGRRDNCPLGNGALARQPGVPSAAMTQHGCTSTFKPGVKARKLGSPLGL